MPRQGKRTVGFTARVFAHPHLLARFVCGFWLLGLRFSLTITEATINNYSRITTAVSLLVAASATTAATPQSSTPQRWPLVQWTRRKRDVYDLNPAVRCQHIQLTARRTHNHQIGVQRPSVYKPSQASRSDRVKPETTHVSHSPKPSFWVRKMRQYVKHLNTQPPYPRAMTGDFA
jgi:hypothetical protein